MSSLNRSHALLLEAAAATSPPAVLNTANQATDFYTGTDGLDTAATVQHTLSSGSDRLVILGAFMEKPETGTLTFNYNSAGATLLPGSDVNYGITRAAIATYDPGALAAGTYSAGYTAPAGNLGVFVIDAANVLSFELGPTATGDTSSLSLDMSSYSIGANDIVVVMAASNDNNGISFTGATGLQSVTGMTGGNCARMGYATGQTGTIQLTTGSANRFAASTIILRSGSGGGNGGEPAGDVTASPIEAFSTTRFDPTALSGWPAGATPTGVKTQGLLGKAFLRRSHRTSTNVGQVDYFSGPVKGTDTFTLTTTGGDVNVGITVNRTFSATSTVTTAAELNTAFSGASTGDVIVVRAPSIGSAQVYDPRTIGRLDFNSGEPAGGFTTMGHPDDIAAGRYPMLWCGGAELSPFWFASSGKWTLHDASSNTYKSTITISNPGLIGSMAGMYLNANGDWQRLYFYQEAAGHLAQLTSTSTSLDSTEENHTRYSGPGFVLDKSTGELYVRLEPPYAQQVWGTHFYDYSHRYPPSTNPNNVPLMFGLTEGLGSSADTAVNLKRTTNAIFENIWVIGGGSSIHAGTTTGLTIRGCTLVAQCQKDVGDDGNVSYSMSGLIADGTNDTGLLIDNCTIAAGVPPWVSWGETKGYQGAYGLSMRGVCVGSGTGDTFGTWEIRNSLIQGWFNLHSGDAKPNFRVHHNRFELCHGDGMLLQSFDLPEVHFSHNVFYDSNLHGYDGGGAADYAERDPPFFEGHNLVVRLVPLCSRSEWWTGLDSGNSCSIRQIDVKHGEIGPWAKPLARYHCTMVVGAGTSEDTGDVPNCNQFGRSWDDAGGTLNTPNGNINGSSNDRFYNNIACSFPSGYGVTWVDVATTVDGNATNFRSATGDINYESDGTHAFRDPGTESNPGGGDAGHVIGLVHKVYDQSNQEHTYSSMANLRAAGWGIEASGTDGDPLFEGVAGGGTSTIGHGRATDNEPYDPAYFCLKAGSPCATGAVNISGWHPTHSIPWYDGYTLVSQPNLSYRGCMDPALPAVEQPVGPLTF